ncbi:MAG: 30S ribosomal protein S13 [Candidatus Pacebacteria bacterium CG_4_10_14_0_8_um_filter_43_12]|nr:MAG: 30S ribosomal protein S13 [Candidatus Pacebacteria bacterium CG10_big_fil_rev_8_21_14_0_10_44_11]PIY79535.1 MAG: 30S ribosomal protein S13 [Candidatus Pacebacteria bacterium CG_4_10_14_0_8_um_filter_43_12]
MIRIGGVDLPENKKVAYSLRSIYGVGMTMAKQILQESNVDPDKRTRELTNDEINRIQRSIERIPTEGDLRRIVNDNIDHLKRIKTYRGSRHAAHLPARGQRTRTNSRSARGGGRRKTVGALSKELAAKLEETQK